MPISLATDSLADLKIAIHRKKKSGRNGYTADAVEVSPSAYSCVPTHSLAQPARQQSLASLARDRIDVPSRAVGPGMFLPLRCPAITIAIAIGLGLACSLAEQCSSFPSH